MTSDYSTNFISGGTIYVNSDGDVEFYGDDVDIDIRTTGTDSRIFMYSSGSCEFDAQDYFVARTAELPGADLKVTTTLGHVDITSDSNIGGITLNLLASFGNLTFSSSGDDGDIYLNSNFLDIQVDGDFVVTSTLNLGNTNEFGIEFNIDGDMLVNSEYLSYFAAEIDIDASAFTITTSSSTNGIGGSIHILDQGSYSVQATTSINFLVEGEGANIIIESELGDILFFPRGSPASYTTSISANSIMKIPGNDVPGTSNLPGLEDQADCRNGEMFFIASTNINSVFDAYTSDSFVCMCLGAGNLHCTLFKEPPYNRYYYT